MVPTILTMMALTAGRPTAPALPQPDSDETVVRRVYDLRDLSATLPETESLAEVTDTVFAQLIGASHLRLEEGVYVVDALPSEHRQAEDALETLRSLHAEGFQVRIEVLEGESGQQIRVGQARPEGDSVTTLAVVEQFVRRRSPVTIAATNQSDYIVEWSPIVSDNAVGYDPEIKSLVDGLTGTLVVGAGIEAAGRVRVQLTGDLRSGDLIESTVQAPGAAVISELPIFMARVASRGMDFRASVPLGRATIIGALQGFGSESQIAVVVEVRPAE